MGTFLSRDRLIDVRLYVSNIEQVFFGLLACLVMAEFSPVRRCKDATFDDCNIVIVLDPGKGVCADPVERVAILEVKGPGPPGGVSERQLSSERGGEKT